MMPIISYYFAKEFEDGTVYFYENKGLSLANWFWSKFFAICLVTILLFTVSAVIYFLISRQGLLQMWFMIIMFIFIILYSVLISSLIALFSKKKLVSVFLNIGIVFLLSLINFFSIPVVGGYVFLLDGNSVVTKYVELYFCGSGIHGLLSLVIAASWCVILAVALRMKINYEGRRNGGNNNLTRHHCIFNDYAM